MLSWHKAEDTAEKTKSIVLMGKEKKNVVHVWGVDFFFSYTPKHSYKPFNELTASYFLCIFLLCVP